jgi:hypothetical protein
VELIRELLGVERLYRTADPLISCPVMYYLAMSFDTEPGAQFSEEIRRRYAGRVA